MHTDTLIIGGGLSGLSLALQLQDAGVDYHLVEARARLGGRIKSLVVQEATFDLGPSWFWPGQTRVAALLERLGLAHFAQWSKGDQLLQQADGAVIRNAGFMSMAGSLRVAGGTGALTNALAAQLPKERIHLSSPVVGITDTPSATLDGGQMITAKRIVLALPPRIAATLDIAPPLPFIQTLQGIPTWMGAHAKFVAVYETPFWRDADLSGDASSRRGPMVEIHDASPAGGGLGALFGFVGLPAHVRAQAGDQLEATAIAQLTQLFGPDAANPIAVRLQDWSTAQFTSTTADATPPAGHPPYQMPAEAKDVWDNKLIFATTEMAPDNGGLIEGALAAAEAAAAKILSA